MGLATCFRAFDVRVPLGGGHVYGLLRVYEPTVCTIRSTELPTG